MEIAYTKNLLNKLVIFIFIFNLNKQSKYGKNQVQPHHIKHRELPHHIKHKLFTLHIKHRASY